MPHHFSPHLSRTLTLALSLLLLFALSTAVPVHASGTVSNCSDDTEFSNALSGGGTVNFDCPGNGVATIILRSTKTISADTTIDGGGKITLSGDNARRLFTVNNSANLDLRNIVLENGNSTGNGGAVDNSGFLELDNATIRNSSASGNGGAIISSGPVDITNSTLANNIAANGGAIDATGSSASVNVNHSRLQDNQATTTATGQGGGALYIRQGAQVYIYSSDIYSNTATTDGGAIFVKDTGSSVSLQSSTKVRKNSALTDRGGAIYNNGATANLTDVTLSGNKSVVKVINGGVPSQGGAIYNHDGNLTLTNVTLNENTAYEGGGIFNEFSTANLTNVTLSGNSAEYDGGGIYNNSATANLTNVTLSGNSGRDDKAGGISNSSVVSSNPHLNLKNVLVANSARGANCKFDIAPDSSDSNLSTDGTCNFGTGRDNVTVLLGPLETNGGLTLTQRLLPGSLAIDDGNKIGCPSNDQRGVLRYYGHSCDVGAVEFVPCPGVPAKPVLVAPTLNRKLRKTRVKLDWAGPDCATKFKVIVRQDSVSGPLVFSQSVFPKSQVTTPDLPRGHWYYWRVRACNAAGCTAGDWWSFEIKSF